MTSLSGRFIFRVCNSNFTEALIDKIVFIKCKFVIYRKRMIGRELLKSVLFESIE